jgi:pimeloyl-ACP methyl ester carboxylesterase
LTRTAVALAAALVVSGAFAGAFAGGAAGQAAGAAAKPRKVSSTAVTFQVANTNRSAAPCSSDGAAYQVKGHLVGPRSALASLRRSPAVTLYMHGLGMGEWLWNFKAVPGYSYVRRMAERGHVSVSIDRLGYGASGHPNGFGSCVGAQADVAHQIVQALRTGSYSSSPGAPLRFKRVALVGHSASGEIANVEAYSFKDVDALVVEDFSFQNLPRGGVEIGEQRAVCDAGGELAGPGLPGGYAFFGQTPAGFRSAMFHSARRTVVDAAVGLHNRDPCGDNLSLINILAKQKQGVRKIKVPVLVICGSRDALYAELGCEEQMKRYTGTRDRRLALIRNAGHVPQLERSAGAFRDRMSRWLGRRGF